MSENIMRKIEQFKKHLQELDDEITKLGLEIKHHEDNLKLLHTQKKNIEDSILYLRVGLERYASNMVECINQEKSAASIICKMKYDYGLQASYLSVAKDVLGVVATLGEVDDDNLSRLLSEFLGLETMLGIVCKTYEGVKALEKYGTDGIVDKQAGLHELGSCLGMSLDGSYPVFCLEYLRPYVGEVLAEDSQKKLQFPTPRLPNGECPSGFLGFAVNMIHLNSMHLSDVTVGGHGLRETLFYHLFSHLHVYKTRAQMHLAISCIRVGAISLDGGMIKGVGICFLGDRKDVDVRFHVRTEISRLPSHVTDFEEKLKLKKWEKEKLVNDVKTEYTTLNNVKDLFHIKRQEFMEYISEARSYLSQNQSDWSLGDKITFLECRDRST